VKKKRTGQRSPKDASPTPTGQTEDPTNPALPIY